jgi:NADPH2:quinone reductase
LETVEDLPAPGAGEVRVRGLVTSAAFTDVMIRKGMDPDGKDKPPFTLGHDMVGIVDATGPDTVRFKPGDRVADFTTIGAYAEHLCMAEERLTRVPDAVSDVDALSMILSAVTRYQMLTHVAKM